MPSLVGSEMCIRDSLETFEEIPQVVKGMFWIPRSKKSGIWNYYAENGTIISHKIHKLEIWKEDKIRNISSRYWLSLIHI